MANLGDKIYVKGNVGIIAGIDTIAYLIEYYINTPDGNDKFIRQWYANEVVLNYFETNIERDAYFITNPTLLIEEALIFVNTLGAYKYTNSEWITVSDHSVGTIIVEDGISEILDARNSDIYVEKFASVDGRFENLEEIVQAKTDNIEFNTFKDSTVAVLANNTQQLNDNTQSIIGLSSDTPKGIYATFVALQTAYPAGTTGKFIVGELTAEKHWYVWLNAQWTDGGVYQGIGIANNSIKSESLEDYLYNNQIQILKNIASSTNTTDIDTKALTTYTQFISSKAFITRIIESPATVDGVVKLHGKFDTAVTIKVYILEKNVGTNQFRLVKSQSISVAIGENHIDTNLIIQAGQYVGIYSYSALYFGYITKNTYAYSGEIGSAYQDTTLSTTFDFAYYYTVSKSSKIDDINKYILHQQISKTVMKMLNGNVVKIVCFGDSITWGQASSGQVAIPYPVRLQEYLRSVFNNNNITVVNAGVSGNSSTMGLARYSADVVSKNPDCVIVMFGINDAKDNAPIDYVTYTSNIDSMLTQSIKNGYDVVVTNLTPTFYSDNASRPLWNDDTNRRIQKYGDICKELADKYNLCFIDVYNAVYDLLKTKQVKISDIYLGDFLHLLPIGYDLLASMISSYAFDSLSLVGDSAKDNILIPCSNSQYVRTDVPSNSTAYSYQDAYFYFGIKADGTTGTYVRFSFYNMKKDAKLYLVSPKDNNGGVATFTVNGASVVVDFNQSGVTIDNLILLSENLKLGYNFIELLNTNIVSGSAYFSQFKIVNNNVNLTTKFKRAIAYKTYKKVFEGKVEFENDVVASQNYMLFTNKIIDRIIGKTLKIKINGILNTGHGVSWLAQKNNTLEGVVNGYTLLVNGSTNILNLYTWDASNNPVLLASSVSSITPTNVNDFEIIQSDSNIIVNLNGVEVVNIAHTTKYVTGYFGLYHGSLATVNKSLLNDISYSVY